MKHALHVILGLARLGLLLGGGLLFVILPLGLFSVREMPAWPWALDIWPGRTGTW